MYKLWQFKGLFKRGHIRVSITASVYFLLSVFVTSKPAEVFGVCIKRTLLYQYKYFVWKTPLYLRRHFVLLVLVWPLGVFCYQCCVTCGSILCYWCLCDLQEYSVISVVWPVGVFCYPCCVTCGSILLSVLCDLWEYSVLSVVCDLWEYSVLSVLCDLWEYSVLLVLVWPVKVFCVISVAWPVGVFCVISVAWPVGVFCVISGVWHVGVFYNMTNQE